LKNDPLKPKVMLKKIGLGLFAIFVIIQFFRIDKENPEVVPRKDFITQETPPESVQTMLKNACYDCHSNETKYPWYSNVAPISWWLADHIEEGREELNFSEWADYPLKKQIHKMEECWEMLEEGEMPLESYLITHSEAELTSDQKEMLIEFFKLMEHGLADTTEVSLNDGEKWEINSEVTTLIEEIRAGLKQLANETDIAKINAEGAKLEEKLMQIGDVFDAKKEALDQFNRIHGELYINLPPLKEVANIKDAQSIILVCSQNLNNYQNYFESKQELILDGSKKWEANIETTTGINNMLSIVSEEVEQGRVSYYAAMGERLNLELKTIFSSCTMKGEAHEQLHLFIMPLVDLCEQLEMVEKEDDALILQRDILKQLNLYNTYFTTESNS